MFKRYEKVEGFTTLKGSGGLYSIDVNGQIKDTGGTDVKYSDDEEGYLIVHCLGWDGERDYRVADLVAIQFKQLCIPKVHYSEIKAFHIDDNKYNIHASNIGYRFIKGPVEYIGCPGYYYIPGYTFAVINKEGGIYNTVSNKFLNWAISKPRIEKNIKNGYYRLVANYNKKRYDISRHRALLLTFGGYPNNVDSLTANHKNGTPGDDRLDNLEWTTRSENNKHAVLTGLRTQNTGVLVRNVLTNEIKEYPSMAECARQMNFKSTETISYRITNCKFGYVFKDGTQIKLKSDVRDWVTPDELTIEKIKQLGLTNHSLSTPIIVRNCRNFTIKEYSDIKYAPVDTKIEYKVISDEIFNRTQKVYNGYQFKHKFDKNPWRNFTTNEFNNSLYKGESQVNFRNLITGEERNFPNIWNAETWLGKDIYGSISSGKQPLFIDGWQAKLSHWEWEEIKDLGNALYRLQKEIMAYNPITKEIIIANNATELAKVINGKYDNIRTAALTKGQKLYKGYQIRLGVTDEQWPDININS